MDKDVALMQKALDSAVQNDVLTDSEADHLFTIFANAVNEGI